MTVQTKVYLEIVQEIRSIMEEEQLKGGDRLPSERELSARLKVGRSSVREALRALELVGVIETRRGEGTFIRNSYEHNLVQVLASFVLRDEKARKDLLQMQILLERGAVRILCQKDTTITLPALDSSVELPLRAFHHVFWKELLEQTSNHLLYRIWTIVNDYIAAYSYDHEMKDRELYSKIYKAIERKNETEALYLHDILIKNIVHS